MTESKPEEADEQLQKIFAVTFTDASKSITVEAVRVVFHDDRIDFYNKKSEGGFGAGDLVASLLQHMVLSVILQPDTPEP